MGSEADHSSTFRANVRIVWGYTSARALPVLTFVESTIKKFAATGVDLASPCFRYTRIQEDRLCPGMATEVIDKLIRRNQRTSAPAFCPRLLQFTDTLD